MKLLEKIFLLSVVALTLHSKPLPLDSSLISGELENGFKYTIKKNTKPSSKAEMRLIVNVGSIEEDDDQKGVAHLVEHMAFNGTKHFPKNTLISYLESIGVAFGSHLNASTGMTRTLYKLSVPLEKENLQKSFLIFEDWAAGLSFKPQELQKERGVVLEEARSRDNVNFRLYLQSKNTLYANSKYKDRTPIGDLDIIQNIKVDRVKDFYDDWYRPEHMHLVIVGDIDISEIKDLIKKHFSKLTNNSTRKRVSRDVPLVDEKRVLFVHDKELVSKSLGIYYFNPINKATTTQEYKKKVLKSIAMKLFNLKNTQLLDKENPIANTIKISSQKLGDKLSLLAFSAKYDGDKELEVLKELTQAIYLHENYGFTQESFESVIKSMNTANELAYKKLGDASSESYAKRIVSHSLKGTIFIDEVFNYKLLKEILENVSLQEVNTRYKELLQSKSQLVLFSLQAPSKLLKKDILVTLEKAKTSIQKPKESKKLPKKVLEKEFITKKILNQKHNKKYDFWEFELENGVKVIYKHNEYQKRSVNLYAYSKGGYSLVDDSFLTNAKFSTNIIAMSGTSKYTVKEIQKINAEKTLSLQTYITRYSEGFKGKSSQKDFEALLELIYLAHTDYKVNPNVLTNTKNLVGEKLKQQDKNPKSKFFREYADFYMDNNIRFKQMNQKDLETLSQEEILKIYRDRFADANNFVYIIVGDISYEKVKLLTAAYLGNLPVVTREETYKDRNIRPLGGKHKFIRFYENKNISTIGLSFTKKVPYSLEESIKLDFLKEVLNVKLREFIREEKSGVYGVRVQKSFLRVPYDRAAITIHFTCNPKRRVELLTYVKSVLNELKNKTIQEKYVNAIIKKKIIAFDQNIKMSKFWQDNILKYSFYADDINQIDSYKNIYNSITPKTIQLMAQKYLSDDTLIHTELNPEALP